MTPSVTQRNSTKNCLTASLRPSRLQRAYLGFPSSVLANSKHSEPVHMFSRLVFQILLLSGTIRFRCDTFCDTRRRHQKLPYGLSTASSAQTAYLGFLSSVLANSKHAEPVYMFSRPVSQILLLLGTIRCRCDTCCDTRRQHQKLPCGLFTASLAQTAYLGFPRSVLATSKHAEPVYMFFRPVSQLLTLLETIQCRCGTCYDPM